MVEQISKNEPYFKGLDTKMDQTATRIDDRVLFWKTVLGITDWQFDVLHNAVFHDDSKKIRATINCSWEYKSATMNTYLPAMMQDSIEEQDDAICHELVHCLIDPLHSEGVDIKLLEFTVVNVQKSFSRFKKELSKEKPAPKKIIRKKVSKKLS